MRRQTRTGYITNRYAKLYCDIANFGIHFGT